MEKRQRKRGIIHWGILFCLLVIIVGLVSTSTYAFWGEIIGTRSNLSVSITIGEFLDDISVEDNLLIDLIPNSADVKRKLTELPDEVKRALIPEIENVAKDPYSTGNVFIGFDIEDLFEEGMPLSISPGDILMFTITNAKGELEVNIFYNYGDEVITASSAEDFNNVLHSHAWTGMNTLSKQWVAYNMYNASLSPVEYNGKYYLPYHNGASSLTPDKNRTAWFLINDDYEFDPANIYYKDCIVKFGFDNQGDPEYYMALHYIQGEPNTDSWAWTKFLKWSQDTTYKKDDLVWFYDDDNNARLWRALVDTDVMPEESSAEAELWRELANGWKANMQDEGISYHYQPHNTYTAGMVVIYGESFTHQYRYYEAKRDVPAGEEPLLAGTKGEFVVNDTYWKAYY